MKELESNNKDQIVIVDEKQQRAQEKLIQNLKPQSGHKCFELNLDTGDIVEATYQQINVSYLETVDTRKKLKTNERCLYTTALNMKNAIKRFKKMAEKQNLNQK